jgi:hypothetical protein
MKILSVAALALIQSLILAQNTFADTHTSLEEYEEPNSIKASVESSNYKESIKKLRDLGVDIAGVDIENNIVDVLLNDSKFNLLIEKGILPEVNFTKGVSVDALVDPEYQNAFEVESFVINAHSFFPELTKLVEIGKSLEGRSIWALKISDNAESRELDEPTILFNSMHHAREVMTPEVSLDIIEYLLTNYESDQKVKSWVDGNEIWVVPMLNVDGNAKVWAGQNMWRKNARDGHGVDLNRNYPFGWNSCNGSSGRKSADDYRGPEPASEPETRALMSLVEEIKPVFDISYHSYSQLVLYPYGCKNSSGASNQVMKEIGQEMGKLLGYRAGTPWEILYEADGSDIDWMLGEHQVIPYVIELNSRRDGFQPPYAETRDRTVELNRKGWMHLLDRLEGPGVRGLVENFNGDGFVKVYQNDKLVKNYQINPDGTFHIVLKSGEYEIISDNFTSQRINIGSKILKLKF